MKSYFSPKTEKRKSTIEGKGLFAVQDIKKGEVVAVKGGHIFNKETLARVRPEIGDSYFQITEDLFVGPMKEEEVADSMIGLNHSCEPNAGIEGNIVFVAMRDIKSGEEITIDYAICEDEDYKLKCNCHAKSCRKLVTGKDWMRKEIQKKYNGYFSAFLQKKISQ